MTTTPNLHLPQWEETDRIQMDDFNDAMASIDAAVAAAGNCKIAYGSYTGTGQYGSSHKNTMTFDFAPKALFICGDQYFAFLIANSSFGFSIGIDVGVRLGWLNVTWSGNSVSWYCATHYVTNTSQTPNAQHQLNSANNSYSYIVVG